MVDTVLIDRIHAGIDAIKAQYFVFKDTLTAITDVELLNIYRYIKESKIKLAGYVWVVTEQPEIYRQEIAQREKHTLAQLEKLRVMLEEEISIRSINMNDNMKKAIDGMKNELLTVDERINVVRDKLDQDIKDGTEAAGIKAKSMIDKLRSNIGIDITGILTAIASITVIIFNPVKLVELIGDALDGVW